MTFTLTKVYHDVYLVVASTGETVGIFRKKDIEAACEKYRKAKER